MITKPHFIGMVLPGLILMSVNAWGASTGLEGNVKDLNGNAIKGAEIRIEARDSSGFSAVTRTDAKGHYAYSGLAGDNIYRVSLLLNGSPRAIINNVKAFSGQANQLNFDLKGSRKNATHMVFVPEKTGTNTGGRWVEVDGLGEAEAAKANKVRQASGDAIYRIQSNSGTRPTGR